MTYDQASLTSIFLNRIWKHFDHFYNISTKPHHFYMNRYWLLKIAKRADGGTQGSLESDWTMGLLKLKKDLGLCQNRQVQSFWFSGHFCGGERSISCIMGGRPGLNVQRHQKGTCTLLKDRFLKPIETLFIITL